MDFSILKTPNDFLLTNALLPYFQLLKIDLKALFR